MICPWQSAKLTLAAISPACLRSLPHPRRDGLCCASKVLTLGDDAPADAKRPRIGDAAERADGDEPLNPALAGGTRDGVAAYQGVHKSFKARGAGLQPVALR